MALVVARRKYMLAKLVIRLAIGYVVSGQIIGSLLPHITLPITVVDTISRIYEPIFTDLLIVW